MISFYNDIFAVLHWDLCPVCVSPCVGSVSAIVFVRTEEHVFFQDGVLVVGGQRVASFFGAYFARVGEGGLICGTGCERTDSVWGFGHFVLG